MVSPAGKSSITAPPRGNAHTVLPYRGRQETGEQSMARDDHGKDSSHPRRRARSKGGDQAISERPKYISQIEPVPPELVAKWQAGQLTQQEIDAAHQTSKNKLRRALQPDPKLIGEIDEWIQQHPIEVNPRDAKVAQRLEEAIKTALSVQQSGDTEPHE